MYFTHVFICILLSNRFGTIQGSGTNVITSKTQCNAVNTCISRMWQLCSKTKPHFLTIDHIIRICLHAHLKSTYNNVQSQYRFVYETLLEYTRGIDSRFPVSELANKIKEKGVKDKKIKKNIYQVEYEVRRIGNNISRQKTSPKRILFP